MLLGVEKMSAQHGFFNALRRIRRILYKKNNHSIILYLTCTLLIGAEINQLETEK